MHGKCNAWHKQYVKHIKISKLHSEKEMFLHLNEWVNVICLLLMYALVVYMSVNIKGYEVLIIIHLMAFAFIL